MERNGRVQQWLIIFLLGVAVAMGLVIALLLRERGTAGPVAQTPPDAAPSSAAATSATDTALRPTATAVPSSQAALPTPTFVPVADGQASAAPDTPSQPPAPTAAPAAADPVVAAGTTVRLEDSAWQGGFRSARGYGGRSATWVYGAGTEYSTMQATIEIQQPSAGTATLTIEGMDSEDRAKTPIEISVNDIAIFSGANPLPNDDLPLNSGTWASADFRFDAALLRAGTNVVRITNLKPGRFSLPPFFMLDYAVLTLPS